MRIQGPCREGLTRPPRFAPLPPPCRPEQPHAGWSFVSRGGLYAEQAITLLQVRAPAWSAGCCCQCVAQASLDCNACPVISVTPPAPAMAGHTCAHCQDFYVAGNPNAPKPHRGAVHPLPVPDRLPFPDLLLSQRRGEAAAGGVAAAGGEVAAGAGAAGAAAGSLGGAAAAAGEAWRVPAA